MMKNKSKQFKQFWSTSPEFHQNVFIQFFHPLNGHNENFVDTLQAERDAMLTFLNAIFFSSHSTIFFTRLRKWILTVFAPRLHLKMNFYCIENHKYGNSILDFTLKLLKIHKIALLMHSVTPLGCPFVLLCLQARRGKSKKKKFKDLLPLKRSFYSGKPSEWNIVKSAVCNCFQQLTVL